MTGMTTFNLNQSHAPSFFQSLFKYWEQVRVQLLQRSQNTYAKRVGKSSTESSTVFSRYNTMAETKYTHPDFVLVSGKNSDQTQRYNRQELVPLTCSGFMRKNHTVPLVVFPTPYQPWQLLGNLSKHLLSLPFVQLRLLLSLQ